MAWTNTSTLNDPVLTGDLFLVQLGIHHLKISWYNLGTLSKDQTANTMPNKYSLSGSTYLSRPYMALPPGYWGFGLVLFC